MRRYSGSAAQCTRLGAHTHVPLLVRNVLTAVQSVEAVVASRLLKSPDQMHTPWLCFALLAQGEQFKPVYVFGGVLPAYWAAAFRKGSDPAGGAISPVRILLNGTSRP